MGEPGLDMGGLTKEWFQLLIKQIFDAEYGMFVYHTHSRYIISVFFFVLNTFHFLFIFPRCYWFSMIQEGNLRCDKKEIK